MKDLARLNHHQRGDSPVYSIIITLIVILIILIIWRVGIPWFKSLQLATYAEHQVNYDREFEKMNPTLLARIQNNVYAQAKSMKIPIKTGGVTVDSREDVAYIKVEYIQPIDVFIYKFNWKVVIEKKSDWPTL
ncbi:hypothetical protein JW979_07535 [bacterium]|nr:hypothetical protein [candidate division CSSED10-310 bacterium]